MIIVTGAWTTVKEQMPALYAQRFADRGFATFTLDFRYWGESGGTPRQYESPVVKVQDIKNAVALLKTLPVIDGDRIGGIGICASAGYMAQAVAEDASFKSFATAAAWLHDMDSLNALSGEETVQYRMELGQAAREQYDRTGKVAYVPAYSQGDRSAAMFGDVSYQVTLASTETISYTYDGAGRVSQQTTSTGLTAGFTYDANSNIKTVTDSATDTTTYTYEPVTNRLGKIEYGNGSSIQYTYDLAGRMKSQTEKGSLGGTAYTTEYDYDAFGNLNWVKDPSGGITTMKYDAGNRLSARLRRYRKGRLLPNGVKTVWQYDDLDRVKSITHINTAGEVLASVVYERQGIGEPTKITREDNTYVKLEYDTALRVTKESHYNAANVLVDETIYTYDAAGKRMGQKTNLGQQTYEYTAGYQLDKIREPGDVEDYDYDANGRLTRIERDGRVLDLGHDVYDRLTTVENETTGITTQYGYDSAGRRISATDGTHQRKFLVTPVMGSGLESTDLMTDGAGNLISNYIYAGGSSPFMRLDANGSPVYYLTDGMGSVIGLADGAGTSAAKFGYDAFGNVRFSQGMGSGGAGGDFRFQGQWLESATGIYHFRARDYDARTGTFLSRDPVNPIETEPESSNPYQGMYNNPYVYSDPTGMITVLELNVSANIQKILDAAKSYSINQVKNYAFDKVSEAATGILVSGIQSIMPTNFNSSPLLDAFQAAKNGAEGVKPSAIFERLAVGAICSIFGNMPPEAFRLGVRYNSANLTRPIDDGQNCGEANRSGIKSPGRSRVSIDYMVKPTLPTELRRDGWLVGDFKLSVKDLHTKYVERPEGFDQGKQWGAITQHAKRYQYVPVTLFVTYNPGNQYKDDLERLAIRAGVAMIVVSLKD